MKKLLLPTVTALALNCQPMAHSGDEKPIPESALKELGKLPARFNGRVTTIDSYARAALWRISGHEDALDAAGDSVSATRWLFDMMTMSDGWRDYRFIPASNTVATLLELPERKAHADGRVVFSPRELPMDRIRVQAERVEKIRAEDRTAGDQELRNFLGSLRDTFMLGDSLTPIPTDGVASGQIIATIERIESIPALRPVPRGGLEWEAIPRTFLRKKVEPDQLPDISNQFLAVLAATIGGDPKKLGEAVSTYSETVKKEGGVDSPVRYQVPRGWSEVGIPVSAEPGYYGDAMQMGRRVICIERSDKATGETVGMNVMVFTSEVSSPSHFFNDWRQGHSLVPVSDEVGEKELRPVLSGGFKGHHIVLSDPARPGERWQTEAVFLQRDSLTVVVTMAGPIGMMKKLGGDFRSFVSSLRFGKSGQVADWFGKVEPAKKLDPPSHGLFAIIPADGGVLRIDMVDLEKEIALKRDGFIQLVDSIRVTGKKKLSERFRFKSPPKWNSAPRPVRGIFEFEARHEDGGAASYVSSRWLEGEWSDDTARAMLNYWRTSLKLEAVGADEPLSRYVETRKVDGKEVTIISIAGG